MLKKYDNLLDLNATITKDLFLKVNHPWEVLPLIKEEILLLINNLDASYKVNTGNKITTIESLENIDFSGKKYITKTKPKKNNSQSNITGYGNNTLGETDLISANGSRNITTSSSPASGASYWQMKLTAATDIHRPRPWYRSRTYLPVGRCCRFY